MSTYRELISLDIKAFRDWFLHQTFTKIIVFVAYLVVLLGVGLGVYFWSNAFFQYLVEYENYGSMTATYILSASFLILIWLGILSSLISTVSFLLGNDKHLDLLLTYPIPPTVLSSRSTSRSALLTFVLLVISLFPLTMAYSHHFWGSVAALLVVMVITQTIGTILGYLTSLQFRKKYGLVWAIFFALVLVLVTWGLLRTTFPNSLQQLSDLPIEEFSGVYSSLPLVRNAWITNSFTQVVSGNFRGVFPVIVLSVMLGYISFVIRRLLFVPVRQLQKVHSVTHSKIQTGIGHFHRLSLVTKDLLSVFRNPRDVGYLVFLVIMVIAFFGLFTKGYLARGIPLRFQNDALSFAFGWLVFFSGTYLLRLAFPLLVNEGQSRWWFLTRPKTSQSLVYGKVLTSVLISFPLLVLALVEWWLLPFAKEVNFLWVMSTIAIVSLAVEIPLLGSLFPDFSLAYQSDKASTTLFGLASIVYVFIVGVGGSYLVSLALKQQIDLGWAANVYLAFGIITAALSWFLATKYLQEYTLDV